MVLQTPGHGMGGFLASLKLIHSHAHLPPLHLSQGLMFEERRLETARELLARGCAELVRRDAPLEPALQLIEAALLISPMLRSCAVRREGGRVGQTRGYVHGKNR